MNDKFDNRSQGSFYSFSKNELVQENDFVSCPSPINSKEKVVCGVKQIFTETALEPQLLIETGALRRRLLKFDNPKVSSSIFGVYISTNEVNTSSTRKVLLEATKSDFPCHIGFSGWHNFDIISHRQSFFGLICDFNPDNKKFIEATLSKLMESEDRFEFVTKIKEFVKVVKKTNSLWFCPNARTGDFDEEDVEARLAQEGGWLASDRSFAYIKHLASKKRIAAITEDIKSTDVFERVGKIFRNNGYSVDSLYLSNICDYMQTPEDKVAFKLTLKAIIQDQTVVINCPDGLLTQVTSIGSL